MYVEGHVHKGAMPEHTQHKQPTAWRGATGTYEQQPTHTWHRVQVYVQIRTADSSRGDFEDHIILKGNARRQMLHEACDARDRCPDLLRFTSSVRMGTGRSWVCMFCLPCHSVARCCLVSSCLVGLKLSLSLFEKAATAGPVTDILALEHESRSALVQKYTAADIPMKGRNNLPRTTLSPEGQHITFFVNGM